MGVLNEVKGTSFNQLIKIIKGIAKRRDATLRREETGRILFKIRELVGSISSLMKEHPYHIPVILHHLSSITSELKLPYTLECVTVVPDKLNKIPYDSCKTCNGVCSELYGSFSHIIRDSLVHLGPKGLSQVLSVYSECKNEEIRNILSEIKLRMCYFLYCMCKNMSKNQSLDDIDPIMTQYLSLFDEIDTMKLHEDDYLNKFINFEQNGSENVSKHSGYYLNLNLMDVCVTLESIESSRATDNKPLNGRNSLDNGIKGNLINELVLKLSFKFLLYHGLTEEESLKQFKFSNKFELDSVCRLMGLFKRFRYKDELILSIIVQILNENIEELDFRNLTTLLDSFSVLSELFDKKGSSDGSRYGSHESYKNSCSDGNYLNDCQDLISNQYNKIDFKAVVSRIATLSQLDSQDLLRSLSTITQVINRIGKRVDIDGHVRLINIIKRAMIRYLSNNKSEFKKPRSISAIAILLNNIQDPEVINLLVTSTLEGLFSFDTKNLYDYSVIIYVLIKSYQRYTKHIHNNYIKDGFNHNHNHIYDHNHIIDRGRNLNYSVYNNVFNLENINANASNKSKDTNGGEKSYSCNDLNLCKVYSCICLFASKCSFYYYKVLKEYLNVSNSNVNDCSNFNNIPLREMCFFLVNLHMFSKLQEVENEFLNECNTNIANLTGTLERFFTKYHTRLCEMDHSQISRYLSCLS